MCKNFKKIFLVVIVGIYSLFMQGVRSETFPNKPLKIIVGYGAGGAVDDVARAVGQAISGSLGQSVIVENKPGAGTNIAVKYVIDSSADGYTLLMAANALAANMALYNPAPFDAEKELTPVALIGRVPVVLAVSNNSPYRNLKQLITWAKAKPNMVNYGTPGNGSTPHMAIEFFEKAAKISLKHIPYRGGSQAITDVIGGQLELVAVNALEVTPQVQAGKLRVLAVLSAKRSPMFPDVPTISENGFAGFEASVWYGLVAPVATPASILQRLHDEVQKALGTKEVKDRLLAVGGEVSPGTMETFKKLIHSERLRYEKIIKENNIQTD